MDAGFILSRSSGRVPGRVVHWRLAAGLGAAGARLGMGLA